MRAWARIARAPFALPCALVALLATAHAYLMLVASAAQHQRPILPFFPQMPVQIVNDAGGVHIAGRYGDAFTALAVVETVALAIVAQSLTRPSRLRWTLIATSALALVLDAIVARAATNADMYSNVGFALLGSQAYTPPARPFAGDYRIINDWWRIPMVPAPYGPLWLSLARIITATGPTLLAKIILLRTFGAVTLAALIWVLAALRFRSSTMALVALNPAIIFQFVANVHNDMFGVVLLLAARLAGERRLPWLTALVNAAAGLIKVPFVLLAAFTLQGLERRRERLLWFGASAGLTLTLSWFAGGTAYLHALAYHVGEHHADPAVFFARSAIFWLALLVMTFATMLLNVWIEGLAYLFPLMGAAFYPWYLAWAIPYAALRERGLRNLALAFPLVTLAIDPALSAGRAIIVMQLALLVTAGVASVLFVRERFMSAR